MSEVSPLAAVHAAAKIGHQVTIGPFCVIGPEVEIGDGCVLMNHVTVEGRTRLGARNTVYQNAVIGVAPQDLKYRGAPTETLIGESNVIREYVTIHRGTENGGGRTVVGSHCLIMVGSHIAHDCLLGNRLIVGNQVQLAGHVTIEDGALLSALLGVHHFVTIGRNSYVGGMTPVRRDVPPFMKFSGDPNEVRGVNEEGLKRAGFSPADIDALWAAYRKLYRGDNKNINQEVQDMLADGQLPEPVRYLCDFLARSGQSRYARFKESQRTDGQVSRMGRQPFEVRSSQEQD